MFDVGRVTRPGGDPYMAGPHLSFGAGRENRPGGGPHLFGSYERKSGRRYAHAPSAPYAPFAAAMRLGRLTLLGRFLVGQRVLIMMPMVVQVMVNLLMG